MSHYFEQSPTSRSAERPVTVRVGDLTFALRTDRGVFGHGQLDAGTRVLLEHAPPPPATGTLLDLGCGTGAIAVAMGLRAPAAAVWAIDVNERARDLTAANAAAAGATNVRVVAPDAVPPDLRFDAIWSNPPIRIGKPALHELLTTWLTRLTPGGQATLVVHKHLGADSLHRWLIEQGWTVARLTSSKGYRLLAVARKTPDLH